MRAQSLALDDQRLGPEQMHCMEVWSGNTAIDKWFELAVTIHGPGGEGHSDLAGFPSPCRLYVSRQVSSFGPKAVQAIAKSVMRRRPAQMA
jgi:hypothetical protein